MKISKIRTACVLLAVAGLAAAGAVSATEEKVTTKFSEIWSITEGGKLYDDWAGMLYYDSKSLKTHSAYPKKGKQSGASTWRCKECHGWDYKGGDGAYSKGSHFTGIMGLRNWVSKDPRKIARIIRDKRHGYTAAMIPDKALDKLALFVSRGQIDDDQYIDRASKKAHGDPKQGAGFYQTICANCHGQDGKQINFKQPPDAEFIGTVANDNPWETLHKIRNGQPGVPMVSMGMLSVQDQIDILAYAQTLPGK